MSSTAQSITISTAAQLATVSRSTERVARARAYATRLGAHAAEIRAQLDAAAGSDAAGPLRGELIEVDRQHRQAVEIVTDVEAEHVRHEADLRTLHGSDGQARAALRDRQAERDAAKAAADDAGVILSRARAHAEAAECRRAVTRAASAKAAFNVATGGDTMQPGGPFYRCASPLAPDRTAACAPWCTSTLPALTRPNQ